MSTCEPRLRCLPFLLLAIVGAATGRSQTPIVHEPVWRLRAAVPVLAPCGVQVSPVDQSIWVGSRLTQASGGAIVRIAPDLSGTANVVPCDRPASVVVDPVSGDAFFSEDYAGFIGRIPFGTGQRQNWVTGFHSGDDDPWGMAIAPAGHVGGVVAPGEALVCDRGVNGPRQIWAWSPSTPENERLVKPDDGTMQNPMAIAISATSVWFVDALPPPGRVFELLPGGQSRLLGTASPLPLVGGIAVDPVDQTLLLRSQNLVLRVDPVSGATSPVVEVPQGNGGAADGIDISSDGRLLVLCFTNANRVLVFERTASFATFGAGCAGTRGTPGLAAGAGLPRLGSTFHVSIGPLALSAPVFGILGLSESLVLLDPLGMTGCRLLVRNDQAMLVPGRTSPDRADWSLAIPASSALEGVELFQQALVVDPGSNPFGAVLSDAGRAVLSAF